MNNLIKYSLFSGFKVNTNNFSKKRKLVKDLKRYAKYRDYRLTNFMLNSIRISFEQFESKFTKTKLFHACDKVITYIEKYTGLIGSAIACLPVWSLIVLTLIPMVLLNLPKAYCDSIVIKKFK